MNETTNITPPPSQPEPENLRLNHEFSVVINCRVAFDESDWDAAGIEADIRQKLEYWAEDQRRASKSGWYNYQLIADIEE